MFIHSWSFTGRRCLTHATWPHGMVRASIETSVRDQAVQGGESQRPGGACAQRQPEPAYKAAFVIPVRTDGAEPMALLMEERRGGVTKLGLLGGKVETVDGASPHKTAAREAEEETCGMMPGMYKRIRTGDTVGRAAWHETSKAVVMVHRISGIPWLIERQAERVVTELAARPPARRPAILMS